jgi:rare lipoprotein A
MGDDTRMLTASINKLTRYEQSQQTMLAMSAPTPAEPAAGRVNLEDYQRSRGGYSGRDLAEDFFSLFGYAEADPVTAAHAAANAMASRETGLETWVAAVDEDARAIELGLGVFRDAEEALRVAEAFALIGAVDEQKAEVEGATATVLTLIRLKPGVRRDDALVMAGELGLKDLILY